MKILFITHRIPYPPNKGEKTRAFHILKYLSAKHDVHLVSLYDDKEDDRYAADINKFCKKAYLFYLNPFIGKIKGALFFFLNKPFTLGYFYLCKMKTKIDELVKTEKFDIIFAYSSSMAQYVADKKGIRKVMDFVDCDSAKWKQYAGFKHFPISLAYQRESNLLRKYESAITKNFDNMIVVTEKEKEEFSRFTDTSNFSVITNGVDTGFFKPTAVKPKNRLVFTGQMDYFANVDGIVYFCKRIFPLIKEKIRDTELYIVGRKPSGAVRHLAKMKHIFVTGSVDDIREYLKTASVCVIPLRIARGVQNKILEAMASGLPVVATSKTLAGLKTETGKDILVADSPSDFASKVVTLLENDDMRKAIGGNARRYVEENHNWEANLAVLERVYYNGEKA